MDTKETDEKYEKEIELYFGSSYESEIDEIIEEEVNSQTDPKG